MNYLIAVSSHHYTNRIGILVLSQCNIELFTFYFVSAHLINCYLCFSDYGSSKRFKHLFVENEPLCGENQQSAYAKTKTHISFAVTAKLISAFVFAKRIVQFLYYLNPKVQASSHLL